MANVRRIPVIIGVGQVNDRPADPSVGLNSGDLMAAALRAADADAGGGWLARLDRLAMVEQLSCPDLFDLSDRLAEALGASPRERPVAPASGDSPILLLDEAANAIAKGDIEVAAVVGGEAVQTSARLAAQRAKSGETVPGIIEQLGRKRRPVHAQKYGLITPIDIYPLYENALRATYGQSLAQGQQETGEIWSLMSEVAAGNDGAWLRDVRRPEEIVKTTKANRMLAFPYNKLMVANSAVNQGAGFILTSLALARERGIPEDRLVYVGRGAAAHEPTDVLQRDRYDGSSAMEVSIRAALAWSGLDASQLDYVELYSCFPCVPKMARRVLGWPASKPVTVSGGLTFGGGPLGNYMSHAVVNMVFALRARGEHGLLFGNGGLATRYHSIVLSRAAPHGDGAPHPFDVQDRADVRRGPVPDLVETYAGSGRVETYTIFYNRDGSPRGGVVVGRTPGGDRFLAKVAAGQQDVIAALTDGRAELIGAAGQAVAGPDDISFWHMGAPH